MGTQLTKQQTEAARTIKAMFEQNATMIRAALGRKSNLTVDRFSALAVDSFRKTPALLNCSQASLWNASMHAATANIPIGGPLPLAYLVPYGKECQLIISYRGWMEMARRSGEIKNIATGVVHQGDVFDPPDDALDPKLVHKPSTDPKRTEKPVTHVWAGFLFENGSRIYEVLTADEALAHGRQYSPSFSRKDSPWQTAPIQMMLKTAIMRPIKRGLIPISTEAETLLEQDENIIEGSAVEVTPQQQIEKQPEPVEQEDDETPPDLDKTWFDEELQKKMSGGDLLSFRNDCLEQFPNDRQYIFDACEEHDMTLRHAANQEQ